MCVSVPELMVKFCMQTSDYGYENWLKVSCDLTEMCKIQRT